MQEGTFIAPGYPEETAQRTPDVYAANCPTRQLLDRIADKWSVLILTTLGTGSGEMRFNALKRHIEGISQKMLSQTLRSLERDGLVMRHVVPTVPVTVGYAITPLGRELVEIGEDEALHQAHEVGDLFLRPAPVLGGEGVECQRFQPHLTRPAHDAAHSFHAALVTQRARQMALFRPAPVAIHDDGNVARGNGFALGHQAFLESGALEPV